VITYKYMLHRYVWSSNAHTNSRTCQFDRFSLILSFSHKQTHVPTHTRDTHANTQVGVGGVIGVDVTIKATDFLDEKEGYYSYKGSLTTPTCNPVVTWVVLNSVKFISGACLYAVRCVLFDVLAGVWAVVVRYEIPSLKIDNQIKTQQPTWTRSITSRTQPK